MMNVDLDERESRVDLCEEGTVPEELWRELFRLAKSGQAVRNKACSNYGWVPTPGFGCLECGSQDHTCPSATGPALLPYFPFDEEGYFAGGLSSPLSP